jgi:hypothetical protein
MLSSVYWSNTGLLQGQYDLAAMLRPGSAAGTAVNTYRTDFGKMAQEIEAEDAARDGAAGK